MVYPEPGLTLAQARGHAKAFGYRGAPLLDGKRRLAKKLGVIVTPEVAVTTPGGMVLYCGAIDNRYVTFGRLRARITQWYLKDALDAALHGKPAPIRQTPPIGCFIPAP